MPTDDDAFLAMVEPLRGAIRLHGYRMLGSAHDGAEVVQETMLRAWRARASLEDPARVKPWLFRIATNVCLDELQARPRRLLASDAFPPAPDARPPFARLEEPVWLEPLPDTWLGAAARDPGSQYELRESVALAFVAALQLLTPTQRAVLLLRDVVGLTAEETAGALGVSVGAANSALFRARSALEEKLGGQGQAAVEARSEVDEALLARYVRAFEEADIEQVVALFHDEMRTTMPPAPTWVHGREANALFYRRMFGTIAPGQFRHLAIGANGRPALAFYRGAAAEGPHALAAIQLVTTRDGAIAAVDHFMLPALFELFDVPRVLPGAA